MADFEFKKTLYDVLLIDENGNRLIKLNYARYVNNWMMPVHYVICIDNNDNIIEIPNDERQNKNWLNWIDICKNDAISNNKVFDEQSIWIGHKFEGDGIVPVLKKFGGMQ